MENSKLNFVLNFINNIKLKNWIKEVAILCQPDNIYICNGTKEEYNYLMSQMIDSGMSIPLKQRPNSYLFRSDPSDVARIEERTYVSYSDKDIAGLNNNWIEPDILKKKMLDFYRRCMVGRTLYIIPFSMGPIGSSISKIGVEITDSPYVVCNMHIMTRIGTQVLNILNQHVDFIPCLHSIGSPLSPGQKDTSWPCAYIKDKYISHFPDENLIWSYGSGYGGNALLGKKCLGLRIASVIAYREKWMAEHMFIMRITNPEKRIFHLAGAFPSACGKTNLAMIQPSIVDWKCECIGDDIAWMKVGHDDRLYAINPETGFFGVAPGTSFETNPMAFISIKKNTIFTNCALTDDGDVWWESMSPAPNHVIDWKGNDWSPYMNTSAAHPNARFTVSCSQCPNIYKFSENHEGVPIDILIFGGRRNSLIPLVYEAFNWDHGVFLGATISSETTAANLGAIGKLRRDSFAMLPFCGYNLINYIEHWFSMGDRLGNSAPRIFYINWFRKSSDGRWLWPGFSENIRIIKWICQRVDGKVDANITPIGYVPKLNDLDLEGLSVSQDDLDELFKVDNAAWRVELLDIEKYFYKFNQKLPLRLQRQLDNFHQRLN